MGLQVAIVGAGKMGTHRAKTLRGINSAGQPGVAIGQIAFYDPFITEKKAAELLRAVPNSAMSGSLEAAVKSADVIDIAVPNTDVERVMNQVVAYAKSGAFVTAETSEKTDEARFFEQSITLFPEKNVRYLSIHQLCDPERTKDPSQENFLIIRHTTTTDETFEFAKQLFGGVAHRLYEFASMKEHDLTTAHTQPDVSRHTLALASSIADLGQDRVFGTYRNPLERAAIAIALRAAEQPAHVYKSIQFGNVYAKQIVTDAVSIEADLVNMVLQGATHKFYARVMDAKKKLFGADSLKPILDVAQLVKLDGNELMGIEGIREPIETDEKRDSEPGMYLNQPSSVFPFIQQAVIYAETGHNPFKDMRATTPMHTSMVSLMDLLFNTPEAFEIAVSILPFMSVLKLEMTVYQKNLRQAGNNILQGNEAGYDIAAQRREKRFTDEFSPVILYKQRRHATAVVDLSRESMRAAEISGRIQERLDAAA